MSALTQDELDAMQSRCDAAVASPWWAWMEGRDGLSGDTFIGMGGQPQLKDLYLSHGSGERGVREADVDFIAHARQDIPALRSAGHAPRRLSRGRQLRCRHGTSARRPRPIVSRWQAHRMLLCIFGGFALNILGTLIAVVALRQDLKEHGAGQPMIPRLAPVAGWVATQVFGRRRSVSLAATAGTIWLASNA